MASRKRWAIGTVGFLLVAAAVVLGVLAGFGYFSKKKEKMTGTTCPPMLTPTFTAGGYYNGVVPLYVEVDVQDACSPPTPSNVSYMYDAQSGSMNLFIQSISVKFLSKNPGTTTSTYLLTLLGSAPDYDPNNPSWQYGTLTLGWAGVYGSATKPINVQWQ